jgi:site-specific DNA-methyltransferase (adenine-specific)
MFNRGLFSSVRLDYATPRAFYQALDAEFGFALDACANKGNAKCANFFSGEEGLHESWLTPTFMNPPYGRQIVKWVKRACEQSQQGITVVALLPSRTDTAWWQDCVMKANEIRFIRGRLHFDDRGPAPFPSAVVVWRGGLTRTNSIP